jgi:hypothetical protein
MDAMPTGKFKLHKIDAIRGFVEVLILLLHKLEHFNVYCVPPNVFVFLSELGWPSLEPHFFVGKELFLTLKL